MLAWGCALSTVIVAGTAHAQAAPPWVPPQYLAHISVHAAPATQLEIVPSGSPLGTPAVARCTEYCDFWALPGKYTVYTQDSSGKRQDVPLKIKQSSRFNLETGNQSAAAAGLILGISGSVTALVGFLMTLSVLGDASSPSDSEKSTASVGLGVLLVGALATPIGFVMYGENHTRLTRIDEGSYTPVNPIRQVRVGVTGVGLGGLGLAGVASF